MKRSSNKRTPFPKLAQPAVRALTQDGLDHLEQLAGRTEASIRELHGMGARAMAALRASLAENGLAFAPATSAPEQAAGAESSVSPIDAYIARFPSKVQAILRKVRQTIRAAAPEAEEVISYQMPAVRQHGIVVFYAAWKEHVGLYPPIKGDPEIEQAVARYAGPKGNLQFPLDEPMPLALIARIVRLRVQQNLAKHEAQRTKRRGR